MGLNKDNGFVLAVDKQIYIWNEEIKKPRFLSERDRFVSGLVAVKDQLYDGSEDGEIYNTLENKLLIKKDNGSITVMAGCEGQLYFAGLFGKIYNAFNDKLIVDREKERPYQGNRVTAMVGLKDQLYDGGSGKIYRTFDNKIIAQRDGSTWSLEKVDNELYDGDNNFTVRRTFNSEIIAKREANNIYTLLSHGDDLFDGSYHGDPRSHFGLIYKTFDNELIARRKGGTTKLLMMKNTLYDISGSVLYRTLDNKKILNLSYCSPYGSSAISVNRDLWIKCLKKSSELKGYLWRDMGLKKSTCS